MIKKFFAVLLVFAMVFTLAGCAKKNTDEEQKPDTDTEQSEPVNDKTDDDDKQDDGEKTDENEGNDEQNVPDDQVPVSSINIGFMKGPTGIGAAYMMNKNDAGQTRQKYNVTVESDVSNVNAALISGELDMAAVPTNVACTLYNKTNGAIQIIAVNTLGVLYILENGNEVNSIYDLVDKTIYATGQGSNPQYVLEYILTEYGFEIGESVFIEYLPSDELASKMAAGDIKLAMLPVPNATSVLVKNPDVRAAIYLADEWDSVTFGDSILTQGCIVARKDAVDDAQAEAFLADYEESINFMSDGANTDEAAALAAKYEIVASEEIAKKAIPDCGLIFMSGADEMREKLSGYYEVLYGADPASIGGSMPDDGFYR